MMSPPVCGQPSQAGAFVCLVRGAHSHIAAMLLSPVFLLGTGCSILRGMRYMFPQCNTGCGGATIEGLVVTFTVTHLGTRQTVEVRTRKVLSDLIREHREPQVRLDPGAPGM